MSIGDFNTAKVTRATTIAFWVVITICIGLGIGGFIAPPPGQIDDSVLKYCLILGGLAALAVIREAIKEGRGIKVKHNDTTVEVNHLDNE